jgi:annexin A7/11
MEAEKDCETLKNGLKNKGDALVDFVLSKNKEARQKIRASYKACYGKDLLSDIDHHLHANLKKTVKGLFMRPAEFDAYNLYHAMKGVGTTEDALIEIICTRTNDQLKEIIKEFEEFSPKATLEQWVAGDTSGAFRNLLVALLQCKRSDNSVPDDSKCRQLAAELYQAGEKRLGTNEDVFNKIFCLSSPPEIFSINDHYTSFSKNPLRKAISREYFGNSEKALTTILDYIISPSDYYANRIRKAVKGLGTHDRMLIRALVAREEIDIPEIRQSYQKLFGRSMIDDIRKDTSGDYRKLLLGLASVNTKFE